MGERPQSGAICVVTIHGIGFQQAPDDAHGVAGYADGLHEHLHDILGTLLSDDPKRVSPAHPPGERGVIYVQSSWPDPATQMRSVELGLSRLGRRTDPRSAKLDISGAPLLESDERRIAHIALVYTPAEETGPDPVASFDTAVQGIFSLEHYSSLWQEAKALGKDVAAIVHPPPVASAPGGGNVPRQDAVHPAGRMERLVDHFHQTSASPGPTGAFGVLRTVEDDVAGYVARNVLRQRVRDFVTEALVRLQQRGDVASILINSHSQGTVVAFDVLRGLPYEVIGMIPALVTLGSPLRKYSTALSWGDDVGRIATMQPWPLKEGSIWGRSSGGAIASWTNMWDKLDPVADPLVPDSHWRRGASDPTSATPGLFQDVDSQTGARSAHLLEDVVVDNVGNVAGKGLRAHDYWNNTAQVVPRLADRLDQLTK